MAEEPIVNNLATSNDAPATVAPTEIKVPPVAVTNNVPTQAVSPTAPLAPKENSAQSFRDRLETAKLAMEGPTRTLKREEDETEAKVKTETADIEKQIALINHKKEKLEINWVVLDTKANELKTLLAPVKQEEEDIELAEDQLEGEEHTTTDVVARQDIEKKRWATQDKRKDLEKRKWELETKVLDIENELKKNTTEYQSLLDEEEVLKKKLETLEYEIQAAKERVRQEEDKRRQEEEIKIIAVEEKRRAEATKKLAEEEIRKKEQLLAQKKAEEEAHVQAEMVKKKLAEEKRQQDDADRLKKIEAEQKQRAELETHRQEVARQAKAVATTQSPDPEIVPTDLKTDDQKRAELLEKARQAASGTVAQPIPPASLVETADLTDPQVEGNITPAENNLTDDEGVPSFTPGETSALPQMRTFRSDAEEMLTPEQIKEAKKKFPWLK
ncbi:MAG: hypothetical protein A2571_00585 [Candidatus Vogelbacteria bacterium RIFOXYD1_FULL_44_32]|uniref:Uncharacterized protein n=1 Tax=Candidatus Vogelbacteria bacterium RIFOXYD1_FULL_44_32 TaxID=1802438 RepID=A0A1G2QE30_9BACT|nr:MAG: hypothetical protein A2571_00585 [Candidatus Vogelbacteria bacterium RIFOXYD1_FULL_44_32]